MALPKTIRIAQIRFFELLANLVLRSECKQLAFSGCEISSNVFKNADRVVCGEFFDKMLKNSKTCGYK